ncbi:DUF2461 domain-containing protein [Streptomyces sp. NPDC006971]|uniref:DUF2461 domain-containing protein n=1 Tax=Streptomyces sp. NPDC006971 TaxID=3154784 RepID=UPI0033CB080F
MAEFTGWGTEFKEFFDGLARDNSKDYFEAHRELFRRAVREPAEALVAALEPRYGAGRVFRLDRDLRFSADRRPYHTRIGIEFDDSGCHHYVSASATELTVSVGIHRADRQWVERFRRAVDGPAGGALLTIVEDLEARGFTIGGLRLRTAPRGVPADHPHIRLLRHRSLTADRTWPASAWLGGPGVLDLITGAWDRAAPLRNWLTHPQSSWSPT